MLPEYKFLYKRINENTLEDETVETVLWNFGYDNLDRGIVLRTFLSYANGGRNTLEFFENFSEQYPNEDMETARHALNDIIQALWNEYHKAEIIAYADRYMGDGQNVLDAMEHLGIFADDRITGKGMALLCATLMVLGKSALDNSCGFWMSLCGIDAHDVSMIAQQIEPLP